MKDIILYAYHMDVKEFREYNSDILFKYNGNEYLFCKLKIDEKELLELVALNQELISKNFKTFWFVENVENNLITLNNGIKYVLLKIGEPFLEYDLIDLLDYQKLLILKKRGMSLYRHDWAELWIKKIDYLEYQISERGKSYPVILNSFSYYVGLAENAICYYKNIVKNYPNYQPRLVLAHKRITYPNYCISFCNPLNYIVDVRGRDVCSYLKSMFFSRQENVLNELRFYIESEKPDGYELGTFFARLLYPSYYFDLYERIMEENGREDELLKIVDLIEDYEFFLKEAWLLINKYVVIPGIDWIIKKEL